MADWRDAARAVGWTVTEDEVVVVLGERHHTVSVKSLERKVACLDFTAAVGHGVSPDQVLRLLTSNRTLGWAFWRLGVEGIEAASAIEADAPVHDILEYLRDTAALADQLERHLSEIDR